MVRLTLLCFLLLLAKHAKSQFYLNHIYLVLDTTTISAISNSEFLHSYFAEIRKTTVKAEDGKQWTGLYLFGENTYIEIFALGANENQLDQAAAVAFGVEKEVDLVTFRNRVEASNLNSDFLQRKRLWKEKLIPWFKSLEVSLGDSLNQNELRSWVMSYDSSYMDTMVRPFVSKKFPAGSISRKFYNARVFDDQKLLADIDKVGLSIDSLHAKHISELLTMLEYKETLENGLQTFHGPGIIFEFTINQAGQNRINYLRFTLHQKVEKSVCTFGKSTLSFSEYNATWYFNSPN